MGIYFPRDGGPPEVVYTWGGVSIEKLDAEALRRALRHAMDREAQLMDKLYPRQKRDV
jgi:hypothetical protein